MDVDHHSDALIKDERAIANHDITKHSQVFSQNDEDGAIEEVFRKIGTTDKVKVDSLPLAESGDHHRRLQS